MPLRGYCRFFPGKTPIVAVVALHVACPALFAVIHGAKFYGWRGVLAFVGICLLIGNAFENLSVFTGFPYGHYHFTDVMGPKLFSVPLLLGVAYIGMAYLSWTLARVILGETGNAVAGVRILTLPLVASFLMVAWDLSQEPVWATIVKAWIWTAGGPYFGVPLSNFLGWFLVVFVICELFALYLRRASTWIGSASPSHWRLAVLFYALSAAGNLVLLIPRSGVSYVSDSTGTLWGMRDIIGTCALISIFTMGAFAVMAWIRLAERVARVD